MKQVISFLLLQLLLSSCSIWDDDTEITRPFPVDSISVVSIVRNVIEFTAINNCGSMCWKQTYFESNISRSDVFIKTICVYDGSAVCPEVCIEVGTPVSITLPAVGTYTFHFWQSDSASRDTIIVLN